MMKTVAASSSLDSHIRIWDLESGKQMKAIDCGPGTVPHKKKLGKKFGVWYFNKFEMKQSGK